MSASENDTDLEGFLEIGGGPLVEGAHGVVGDVRAAHLQHEELDARRVARGERVELDALHGLLHGQLHLNVLVHHQQLRLGDGVEHERVVAQPESLRPKMRAEMQSTTCSTFTVQLH